MTISDANKSLNTSKRKYSLSRRAALEAQEHGDNLGIRLDTLADELRKLQDLEPSSLLENIDNAIEDARGFSREGYSALKEGSDGIRHDYLINAVVAAERLRAGYSVTEEPPIVDALKIEQARNSLEEDVSRIGQQIGALITLVQTAKAKASAIVDDLEVKCRTSSEVVSAVGSYQEILGLPNDYQD